MEISLPMGRLIRMLHHTLLREDYEVYRTLPGGEQTSYTIHAGRYKTRPNSVVTRYGDRFDYALPMVSTCSFVNGHGFSFLFIHVQSIASY